MRHPATRVRHQRCHRNVGPAPEVVDGFERPVRAGGDDLGTIRVGQYCRFDCSCVGHRAATLNAMEWLAFCSTFLKAAGSGYFLMTLRSQLAAHPFNLEAAFRWLFCSYQAAQPSMHSLPWSVDQSMSGTALPRCLCLFAVAPPRHISLRDSSTAMLCFEHDSVASYGSVANNARCCAATE